MDTRYVVLMIFLMQHGTISTHDYKCVQSVEWVPYQPPKYLIIIVNRITYSNNRIAKNKSRMPLDLYIKLGPYKFTLQASVDHHG